MNRRLATALALAAFLTFVSAPAAPTGAQSQQPAQEEQPVERSGQKVKKDVQTSCPVHPEIKARTAEKCPKCRAELRKQKGARERDKNRVQPQPQQPQQQGAPANE